MAREFNRDNRGRFLPRGRGQGADFARRMANRGENLVNNVNKAVRQFALLADRQIVMATPVDTGRARSNWLVTIGAPATQVIEPLKKGADGKDAGSAQDAIAKGMQVIGTRMPGQSIHITNNVKYIPKLNAGSSKQAPANFVRIAIMQALKILRKINKLVE